MWTLNDAIVAKFHDKNQDPQARSLLTQILALIFAPLARLCNTG